MKIWKFKPKKEGDKMPENPILEAIESENIQFLIDCSSLIEKLQNFFESLLISIRDNSLVSNSEEYRTFNRIRITRERRKSEVHSLMTELREMTEFIRRFDKKTAEFIDRFGIHDKRRIQFLSYLRKALDDGAGRIAINLKSIEENLAQVKDKDLQNKIGTRLKVIGRLYFEIETLSVCSQDVDGWRYRMDSIMESFIERLNRYFEGGNLSKRIEGLTRTFNDYALRQAVMGNDSIKKMIDLSNLIYNFEAQIKYIEGMLSLINSDIENGEWVRNDGFKRFYEKIETYSSEFSSKFRNNEFAGILLKEKERIREQPFRWIDLLNQLKSRLIQEYSLKNRVVEDARQALELIFQKRITEIKIILQRVIENTKALLDSLQVSLDDKEVLDRIDKGIYTIQKNINRLWRDRIRHIKKAEARIKSAYFYLLPIMESILDKIDIQKEVNYFAGLVRSNIDFDNHRVKVTKSINPGRKSSLSGLVMLLFNLARTDDNLENMQRVRDSTQRKLLSITEDEIKRARQNSEILINEYHNVLGLTGEWIQQKTIRELQESIRMFREIYYPDSNRV